MKKKEIAIFAERLYGGGVERILQTILRYFDYDKYNITIYSSNTEFLNAEFYPKEIKNIGYFHAVDKSSSSLKKLLCKIRNKFRLTIYYHFSPKIFYSLFVRNKYDIVVAFLEGYATRIASGAHNSSKKIAWLHTDIINYHWTSIAFHNSKEELDCYNKFSEIVCVAESVRSQFVKYSNLSKNVTVIYNPIDRERLLRLANENPESLSKIRRHKNQLLIVGTLNKNKGQLRLLHILSDLLKIYPDTGLWIVGDGEYRHLLIETIHTLNLQNNVELFGFRSNPYPFFRLCDIYICASYAEGFNTAITEALVLGKPVVTTHCSGVDEQLGSDSKYGIITDNNETSLRQGLEKMLVPQTQAHYQQMSSKRGKDFCVSKSINKIYSLLQK